jgi:hypothetical protein
MYRQNFRHRRARNRLYPNVTKLSGFWGGHLLAQGLDDPLDIVQFMQRLLDPTAPALCFSQPESPLALTSLIGLPIVSDPSGRMSALRIMVCPVDYAALRVPFILAIEGNDVSCTECVDALCEIDVVG